jgi:hypothetical protein
VVVDMSMLRDMWTQFARGIEAIFDSDTGVPVFERLCEVLLPKWESSTEGTMREQCKAYVRWKLPQLQGLTDDQRKLLIIYISVMQGFTSKAYRRNLWVCGIVLVGCGAITGLPSLSSDDDATMRRDLKIASGLIAATSLGWFIAAEVCRRKFNKFAEEARDLERWLIARGGAGGTRGPDLDSLPGASPYT